jgi:hypothetical protein
VTAVDVDEERWFPHALVEQREDAEKLAATEVGPLA